MIEKRRIRSLKIIRTRFLRGVFASGMVACAAAASSLSRDDAKAYVQDFDPSLETRARIEIEVALHHESLNGPTLEPRSEPLSVELVCDQNCPTMRAVALAKVYPMRPEILGLELMIENQRSDVTLQNLMLKVLEGQVINLANDPFAESTLSNGDEIAFGGVAKEGIGRISLALPRVQDVAKIVLQLTATSSPFAATTSNGMAFDPSGAELWTVIADSPAVAIVNTTDDAMIGTVPLDAPASGLAISGDGKHVLVTIPSLNQVVVIDRLERRVSGRIEHPQGDWRDVRTIVMDPQGKFAYVGSYVGDTISKLAPMIHANEVTGWTLKETIHVGRRPTHMSISPDGRHLFLGHFLPRGKIYENEAWASVLNTEPLSLVKEVRYVDNFNLRESECLRKAYEEKFPNATNRDLTTEGVPSQFAGVFLEPSGRYAWIPGSRVPGGVPVFELGPNHGELSKTFFFGKKGALVGTFNFMVDTRSAINSQPMLSHQVLDMDDVNLQQLRCGRYHLESEAVPPQMISDDIHLTSQANLPSALSSVDEASPFRYLAFTRGGRRLLKLAYAADVVLIEDGVTHHPVQRQGLLLSGQNPLHVIVSPSGNKAYVAYENSMFLSVLDLSPYAQDGKLPEPFYLPYKWNNDPQYRRGGGFLTRKRLERNLQDLDVLPKIDEVGQILLSAHDPLDARLRRGRVLFSSSNPKKYPTLTQSAGGSCGGCHPGGESDGSMWSTMEGERRTMSLYGGTSGRGWLHASATHVDALEFAEVIVRDRLGGDLSPVDSDALAHYVSSGIPKLQSPKVDFELAKKGQVLFEVNCSSCHTGQTLSSGNPNPSNPYGGAIKDEMPGLFDVGTASDFSWAMTPLLFETFRVGLPESKAVSMIRGDRELGSGDYVQQYFDFTPRPDRPRGYFKAPSLTNVWHNAVFFHDARFSQLEEVVAYFNGVLNLSLAAEEQRELVEYLKTL